MFSSRPNTDIEAREPTPVGVHPFNDDLSSVGIDAELYDHHSEFQSRISIDVRTHDGSLRITSQDGPRHVRSTRAGVRYITVQVLEHILLELQLEGERETHCVHGSCLGRGMTGSYITGTN